MQRAEFESLLQRLVAYLEAPAEGVARHLDLAELAKPAQGSPDVAAWAVNDTDAEAQLPAERAARATLLGEVANGHPRLVDKVLPPLLAMAEAEADPAVRVAIGHALGLLYDPRSQAALLQMAVDTDADVRLAATIGLGSTLAGEQPDEEHPVTRTLIALTRDAVPEIRDWATFELGTSRATGPSVSDALLARLGDLELEARAEAFWALAERRDPRVVEPLLAVLASDEASAMEVRAAGLLADPRFHPLLLEWAATCAADPPEDPDFSKAVAMAIGRCRPGAAEEAEEIEALLLATAQASAAEAGMLEVDLALVGTYPDTEVVVSSEEGERRHAIWNFDVDAPADPTTLDRAFAAYRIGNLASWG